MPVLKGNQRFRRTHNRRLLVSLLRREGPLSRSDLARRIGLSPSVLTRRVRALLREGVIREVGKRASGGGRCPTLLAFNPSYAATIGIKVERSQLLAARVDLSGRVLARRHAGIPELAAAARRGEPGAGGVFTKMGHALGLGTKKLVYLLNPEAIILGGEWSDAADLFLPALEETVRRHSLPRAAALGARDVLVVPAGGGMT